MPPTAAIVGAGPWTYSSTAVDPRNVTLVAGRVYVALIAKNSGTGNREFNISDDLGNTWSGYTRSAALNTSIAAVITCLCTAGGAATVSLNVTGGTTSGNWQICEVTSGSALAIGAASFWDDVTTTLNHQAAQSTGFSPVANSVILSVGVGVTGASFGTPSASGGFTMFSGSNNVFATYYKETVPGVSNEACPWSTSVARTCRGASVYVYETSTTYTLTVNPLIITTTGQSTNLSITRRLTVSHLAIASAGQSVSLSVLRRLSVSPLVLTTVGQSVNLTTVSPGSYTLSVNPLILTSTGQSVGLQVNRRISVAPLVLTVAAQQTTLRVSRRLSVQPLALVTTGQQVTLTLTQLTPPPDFIQFTLETMSAMDLKEEGLDAYEFISEDLM